MILTEPSKTIDLLSKVIVAESAASPTSQSKIVVPDPLAILAHEAVPVASALVSPVIAAAVATPEASVAPKL